jgi:tRNA pseudouridine55 synthase
VTGYMPQQLSGVIVVDKPENMTSAGVVALVKKRLSAAKAGHTGTLDPFATGVLACCINNATRLARFFLNDRKKYEAVLCLGVETDTQDLTGNITSRCNEVEFSEKTIRSVFKRFEGAIEQLPPIFSALKHQGIPLYKLARSGRPFQKPARRLFISSIRIMDIHLPEIRFEVSCSAGTYVRTLCADIGKALGCGGHLKVLRRLESGGFTINEAISLEEVKELSSAGKLSSRMINMSRALRKMPAHVADKNLIEKIIHGRIITEKDFTAESTDISKGFIKVVDSNGDLLAVLNHQEQSGPYRYCCVFHK